MAVEPGRMLSHYRLIEKIGEGGMGAVWKAEDTSLNRTVALKFMSREAEHDPNSRKRFHREARSAAALDHPYVCKIYESGEFDGTPFIAMEYLEGTTLGERLKAGRLTLPEALRVAGEVAEALAAAHRRHIVHRDLKPANIALTADGHAKVMDFGLAKRVLSDASQEQTLTALTAEGLTLGTLSYMSPEQVRGQPVDARSDAFSFGIVLYEMLTGAHPFRRASGAETTSAILSETPAPMTRYVGDVPELLRHIVDKLLTKEPAQRYQSLHEVTTDLSRIQGPTASPPERPRRWQMLVVVGLAIVSVVAVFGWWLARDRTGRIAFGQTRQISADPGLEIDPALSLDGKMIAFVAGSEGEMQLYVRQIAGGNAIQLTGEFPGHHRWPQWSPDGTRIVFLSARGETTTINVVPALGGIPRALIAFSPGPDAFSPANLGIATGSPAWSPDGEQIAYTQEHAIHLQSLNGGAPKRITETYLPHSLKWSPDGSRIAYVAGNPEYIFGTQTFANAAPCAIEVVSADGGQPVRVTDNLSLNVSPVWTPDGRSLLFVSNRSGSRDIYQVPVDAGGNATADPIRLTVGLSVHTFSLSWSGDTLAYSLFSNYTNIWSIPIPRAGPVSVSAARPVTTGNQTIEGLAVSRDGQWLAFDTDRLGNFDIFKMPLDSGTPTQITTHPADDFTPAWSPNGEQLAFHSFRNGNRDVYVVSADGGSLQQVTFEPHQERFQHWSQDGRQIVFHSDKTGRQDLYIVSREEDSGWGVPRRLTHDDGTHPRWSPDGRLIAYISIADSSLRVISPQAGDPRVLVHSEDPATLPVPGFVDWSSDSRTVYYKAFDDKHRSSFWSVPASGGKPRLLVQFDDPSRPSNRPEFAAGGDRFFFTIGIRRSDLWLMQVLRDEGR